MSKHHQLSPGCGEWTVYDAGTGKPDVSRVRILNSQAGSNTNEEKGNSADQKEEL